MDSESQSKYISMFAYVCVFMCVCFMHVNTAWKTMPGTVDDSCCQLSCPQSRGCQGH